MESGLIEVIKNTFNWIVYPFMLVMGFFVKKHISDLDKVEQDVSVLKINQAVSETQIRDIKSDIEAVLQAIKEVGSDLKEIRHDVQHYQNRPKGKIRS